MRSDQPVLLDKVVLNRHTEMRDDQARDSEAGGLEGDERNRWHERAGVQIGQPGCTGEPADGLAEMWAKTRLPFVAQALQVLRGQYRVAVGKEIHRQA